MPLGEEIDEVRLTPVVPEVVLRYFSVLLNASLQSSPECKGHWSVV